LQAAKAIIIVKDEYGYLPPLSTPRARLCRARRRAGMRCITVPLHKAQIGALVHKGLLPDDQRSNPAAIQQALNGFLHSALMPQTAVLIELYSKPLWPEKPPPHNHQV
jgi:hypothetical protein